jgi:hypothetical protein
MRRFSGLLVASTLLGCIGAVPETRRAGAHGAAPDVSYEATWIDDAQIEVVVRVRGGGFDDLMLEPGAERFMTDLVARGDDGRPAKVAIDGASVRIPACAGPCTIRYRIDVRAAADEFQNNEFAGRVGDAFFAPSTTWLLHPRDDRRPGAFDLVVKTPDGVEHVNGLRAKIDGTYVADLSDLPQAPYAAFGSLRKRSVPLATATLDLAIAGLEPELGDDAVERWVRDAAIDVEEYLGRFPIERAAVFVVVEPGTTVGHGSALGNGGASILVRVGREVSDTTLDRDWIMTHEMVHLSMPGLHARHNWMEEGLATYLEPVARALRGRVTAEQVWSEWYFDMRQGLPRPDEGGLDGTSSWARTYWGGAIFWMVADLMIRDATGGQQSVRDCLRSTVAAGGNLAGRWSAKRFVNVCDKAFHKPMVTPLYEQFANEALDVDLESIFAGLGVRRARRGIELDEAAPGAALRRSITGDGVRLARGEPMLLFR